MATPPAYAGRKVVLTGGPCAGKTTIAEVLGKAFAEKLVVVPEAASLLTRGGFPRWPEATAKSGFQFAVYHSQLAMEKAFAGHTATSLFLLDRGTLDGAAYWPGGPADFFPSMGTSEAAELARYHRVIYLESASQDDYDLHRRQNPARTEEWAQAKRLDDITRAIWSRHPRVSMVKNQPSFADKVFAVLHLIEQELEAQ